MSIREVLLPDEQGSISLHQEGAKVFLLRHATRGNIRNTVGTYEYLDADGQSHIQELTLDIAHTILNRLENGVPYSSSYIFSSQDLDASVILASLKHSPKEDVYTSTGIKFWRHQEKLLAYKNNDPHTVISTHVSPEGACNLSCSYCSVTYRNTHSRLGLETIQDYIEKLQQRGLQAVVITGGGEPTIYKKFNELVQWLKYERGLSVALITNGTQTRRVEPKTWAAFSWVRVSINVFPKWEERIMLPTQYLDPACIVGCSMVYTAEHQGMGDETFNRLDLLKKVSGVADRVQAKYIRLLPNCLLTQENLILQHHALDKTLEEIQDQRFFHQLKLHGAPRASVCHQAYFRPYLSEEIYHATGEAGAVYPCDSVVLNESYQYFAKEYQLCHAKDILDFLDRKIEMQFDPRQQCKGCVFTQNVNLLEDWVKKGTERFSDFPERLEHEEFV